MVALDVRSLIAGGQTLRRDVNPDAVLVPRRPSRRALLRAAVRTLRRNVWFGRDAFFTTRYANRNNRRCRRSRRCRSCRRCAPVFPIWKRGAARYPRGGTRKSLRSAEGNVAASARGKTRGPGVHRRDVLPAGGESSRVVNPAGKNCTARWPERIGRRNVEEFLNADYFLGRDSGGTNPDNRKYITSCP